MLRYLFFLSADEIIDSASKALDGVDCVLLVCDGQGLVSLYLLNLLVSSFFLAHQALELLKAYLRWDNRTHLGDHTLVSREIHLAVVLLVIALITVSLTRWRCPP